MPADTATADAFAAGQREAREADRVALVTALGMDPATTWEEALEHAGGRYTESAGWEAEELRHAMERYTDGPVADEMQAILDEVDARDSLRWLEELDAAREEGRREGMEAVAAVLDDGFDPWPAVRRTVNVDAMDHRARGGLDAILDAVIADACREIRDLSVSPESVASRYATASDAGIARESEPVAPGTTIYDVEGDL